MTYFLDKTSYKSFNVFARNRLDARSYFIPFSSRLKADGVSVPLSRFSSDRVTPLSGEWQFHYYKKVSEMPDAIDTGNVVFDRISVPSDWQRTGYEPPVYLNTRYQFKLDPPNFPEDCPCGLYRKIFKIDDVTANYFITFLGVSSGFDVYLNGQHIGYGEGSHNSAEFDLSKFIKRGENELLAVVYKFTNGTYLECQDMFRENGIFRDVYLTKLDRSYVFDYDVKTTKIHGKYDLKLTVSGKFEKDCLIRAAVADTGGRVLGEKSVQAENKTFLTMDGLDVSEWSAEIPNVYYLEITVLKDGGKDGEIEFIRDIIGFKTVEIDGEVFKLNEKPIKLLGVNHHDTDPAAGYVMTPQQLLGDIKIMKEFNVNAVRTSHYPPDPIFLLYCDIYGIYVVDEADIETHGCYAIVYKPDLISHDRAWEGHYIDRVKAMYMRDKNRACITMWSLGNEAGGYNNQDTAYAYLKEVCPEIPVHYEAACRTARFRYDVTSEMYPDINRIKKIAIGKSPKKYRGAPYFVCEYCHAMGVGPGGLKAMTDLFFSADIYLGGCIWEFADHAVYNKNGKYKYTYGGDHGEELHDGNFCVDGLVYPDRKPHTGLYNVKVNYSPLKTTKTGVGEFEFFNRNFFRNSEYADVSYTVQTDGKITAEGKLDLSVEPNAKQKFTVDCGETAAKMPKLGAALSERQKKKQKPVVPEHDIYITFEYTDKKTGELIAKEQLTVEEKPRAFDGKTTLKRARIKEEGEEFVAEFEGGYAAFGKKSGNLERLNYRKTAQENDGKDEDGEDRNAENLGKDESGMNSAGCGKYTGGKVCDAKSQNGSENSKNDGAACDSGKGEKDVKDKVCDSGKGENDGDTRNSGKDIKGGNRNSGKNGDCACGGHGEGETCFCKDGAVFSDRPWDGLTGMYDGVFRAPIDNDRKIAPSMIKYGYDSLKPYVKNMKITDGGEIEAEKYLLNFKGQALFKIKTSYAVFADGRVAVKIKLKRKTFKKLPMMTRVGVSFELCECLKNVEYFGRGERENLPDFKEHAPVGVYRFDAADAHEPYIKPQDNCRRTDVAWAEFTNRKGQGIRIEADGKRFAFAAHGYTDRAVVAAAHDEDITRSGTVFVSLDGFTMGAGDNSCGPLPAEEFLLKTDREYEYGFVISRVSKNGVENGSEL
ncbi:MAG: DUF4981 domain-containing protein [Clostridiales bacterium]|jgi:beta-galactosidase/beta-glucuronidase|nr:DUF4981 domain-containing protein [Clostridiales bacterium]